MCACVKERERERERETAKSDGIVFCRRFSCRGIFTSLLRVGAISRTWKFRISKATKLFLAAMINLVVLSRVAGFLVFFLQYFALDVTAYCICEIHCLALDGFNLNLLYKLSSKEKKSWQRRDSNPKMEGGNQACFLYAMHLSCSYPENPRVPGEGPEPLVPGASKFVLNNFFKE